MGIGNIANSGMKASMQDMEVISNNISNASTPGFKRSYTNFADIYPSGQGSAGNQPGLGVSVVNIVQAFRAGNKQATGISTDLLINNNDGFFVIKDSSTGQQTYTRAGRFGTDDNGYLETLNKDRVQGFAAVNNTIVSGGSLSDLQISKAPISAKPSTTFTLSNLRLNSASTVPITTPFSPTDSSTYNFQSSSDVYDSLGNKYTVQLFYINTSTAGTWNVEAEVTNPGASSSTNIGSGSLTFDTSGSLTSSTGLGALAITTLPGAATPLTVAGILDPTTTKSYAVENNQPSTVTDGYSAGELSSYTIDRNGVITMTYSNQQRVLAGQIALATFNSQQNLTYAGNASWVPSSDSGQPMINQKNSTSNITTGSYEGSNVDLTQEMVDLIGAQHNFQANAQVENVFNEVMKTVIQL